MQRSDQRERTSDAGSIADGLVGEDAADRESRGGGGRFRGFFSPRAFLLALVLAAGGAFVGGLVPLIGTIGSIVGLFAAAFVLGLLSSRRRYLEVGLAGAIGSILMIVMTTIGAFLPFAVGFLAENGLLVTGVGAGTGVLVSIVGHYFGRDLRAGLTREV
jgi:hypothetical protein